MIDLRQLCLAFFLGSAIVCGAFADSATSRFQTNVDGAKHSISSTGVPRLSIEGVGVVEHPAWTALYALAYAGVEDYDPSLGLKPDSQRFSAAIDWLKANLVQKNELWVWPYTFDSTYNDVSIKAPWSSAFAQAAGIQALLAHWKITGNKQSLAVARKAAQALFTPLDQGGFLFRSGDDIWFEEIPEPAANPSHILNGHMRVLLALNELAEATGDKQYQRWFSQGSDTLLRWLPQYDSGYWLRYDLNPRKDELLFRLANPYGFANPELAIDRIVLRDPLTGEESVLNVGGPGDAEGALRIAGNDWGQIEQLNGRSVRRLRPVAGSREAVNSEGQMVAPFSYFYLKLPGEWKDNLRKAPYELSIEYLDEAPANLEIQMRSIAPGRETFKKLNDSDLLISGKGAWRKWNVNLYPSDLGYWVGRTYANKHKEYLTLLSQRDARFSAWAKTAIAYAQTLESGGGFDIVQPESKVLPDQTPVLPVYSLDNNGVVLMHMPRAGADVADKIGVPVYSPYIIATQAIDGQNMAGLEGFLKPLGIDKARVGAAPALKWLLDRDNQEIVSGAILYPFDFDNAYNDVVTKASWPSAFAQNYVLKALSYSLPTARKDYKGVKNVLRGVLRSYEVDVSEGGIVSVDKAGGYFFEEVPNRTHVFNAQVSSIPVLFDSAMLLGDEAAKEPIDKGVTSLRRNAHLFDTGYWLRYDLNPKKELLFQFDWLSGDASPLIEEVDFDSPQFSKRNRLRVGSEQGFEGASRIAGLEWQPVQLVDGKQVRAFANGYLAHNAPVKGGTRHNVYMLMQLPDSGFDDYFDVLPHRLVIRYKDVAKGQFGVKVQSINEGNVLDFVPLRNSLITTLGDQQWKEAVIEVRPQDMGWYKGADYQVFEVEQLDRISKLTGDWFFSQYAERQRYYLDAKAKGEDVIVQPSFRTPVKEVPLSVIEASSTYDGFGFDNALDGDSDNNYVAGLEGLSSEYVVLKAARPVRSAKLKVRWESPINYAGKVRLFALDGGVKRALAESDQRSGDDLELVFGSEQDVSLLRLEFSDFSGQPRVLIRLLELLELSSGADVSAVASRALVGNFLEALDVHNPLHIYRLPVTWDMKKLSDDLAGGMATDHQKVLAFMRYIDGFDVGVAKSPSPDDTVTERKGACGSFTNTLLALAAAQGLEGRVVSLLNYPANDGHAVAEIKIDGKWRLYDPTYGAFYTLKGSDLPLSLSDLQSAYAAHGDQVVIHHESRRAGADSYTGRGIFTKANPIGVIGADKPLIFPLSFDLAERKTLDSSEFGPRWQGANFIGAASTNQQQDWLFKNLQVGKRYRFEVTASWLGGDLGPGDSVFRMRASVKEGDGEEHEMVHDFDFKDEKSPSWSIPFLAVSESQLISIRHDYLGPKYRYMTMQSYKILEED
ncbi:D-glucuronyl C5-epimerase family protein [Pseudomonas sp. BMW13]|uniref:D-glucuronyl C5-epimerase family protein n=1 Tax=Pseudomonas sp. BMW13 TaxID=2562590 RepID=UPI001583F056|nr:D-glucuronyl C5-epimerase family protein [Pseudomonas sp. BMW13]